MELYLSQTSLSRFQALQYKTVPSSVLRAKVRIRLGSKFRFIIKSRGNMIVQYRVRKRITNKNRVKRYCNKNCFDNFQALWNKTAPPRRINVEF